MTEHNEGDFEDNEDHKAWLYNKASLHAVDSYFMKTRRRIHMCERPIRTSSSKRIWSAYQAYNPAVLVKLLEIFRVVHNYIDTPDKGEKTTPAMRLGLADAVLDYGDVLYFRN